MTPQLTGSSLYSAEAYHTDPDCHLLTRQTDDPREVSDAEIEYHDLEECRHCAGEANQSPTERFDQDAIVGGDA